MAEAPPPKPEKKGFSLFGGGGGAAAKTPKAGGGLFGGKPAALATPQMNYTEISNSMSGLSRRLRISEERLSALRERLNVVDKNMLGHVRDLKKEMQVVLSDVSDMRKDLDTVRADIKLIIKELQQCAKDNDFKVLEKYVNLWDPIKYVSRNEVSKMIKNAVEQEILSLNLKLQEEKYIDTQVEKIVRKVLRDKGSLK